MIEKVDLDLGGYAAKPAAARHRLTRGTGKGNHASLAQLELPELVVEVCHNQRVAHRR